MVVGHSKIFSSTLYVYRNIRGIDWYHSHDHTTLLSSYRPGKWQKCRFFEIRDVQKWSKFLPISRIQIAGRNREKKWLESCSENKSTVFSATLLIGLYSSESRLAISRFKNFVSHFELTSFDAWKQLFWGCVVKLVRNASLVHHHRACCCHPCDNYYNNNYNRVQ